MFTALASSPQVRLSLSTNTQGLPLHRLTYIALAGLKLHIPFRSITLLELNINPDPLSEFSAFVGIDWADKKHDVCVRADVFAKSHFSVLPNKVEDIDTWALELHEKFPGSIAVAIELSKGPMVYALQKYDFFVIFLINPSTLAKYRVAFKPSRAKAAAG